MLRYLKGNLLLKKTLQVIGIDRAVAYTLLSRGWQFFASFCAIFLIARFLSPIQQGFFYTFSSVLGLQIFFELGLTFVVLQFTSHERANLNWTQGGILDGDQIAKARLGSLIRLSLKWYAYAAGLLVVILIPAGLLFFSRSIDAASAGIWQVPWVWLVLTTAGTLLLSPIFAVLEGCGLVAEVARFRFVQDLVAYPIYWLSLATGAGLFASAVLQTVRILISVGWLLIRYRPFLSDQLRFRLPGVSIHWRREVWPMQWKIALSWMSGYLIFQLFNPVLFAYYGAVVAGQMGMSLTIVGAVTSLSSAWMYTKVPTFGQLIERRDYQSLDRLFLRTLSQLSLVAVIGGIVLCVAVVVLNLWQIPLSQRVLAPLPFALLAGVAVINVVIFSLAAYLRAHKQEPFLTLSIVVGVLISLSTVIMGKFFSAPGVSLGYLLISALVEVPWAIVVWLRCRREWHTAETPAYMTQ